MIKRALVLGTYPIIHPQHGGQHRVAAIVKQYKKNGINTKYVGIFYDAFYADKSQDDIALSDNPEDMTEIEKYTTDVLAGKRIWDDNKVRAKLKKLIEEFNPDAIQIEQMFPYFGLKPLLDSMSWTGKIIYSSHNNEHELKKTILQGSSCDVDEVEAVLHEIKGMEAELTGRADIVISCTNKDQNLFKQISSKATFVLAPNGIESSEASSDSVTELVHEYEKRGVHDIALYVGSGHPPNLVGYEEMIGYGTAFVPSDARIVVVGGVADMIWGSLQKQPNYIRIGFEKRVELLGRVSDIKLAALLKVAKVILLPITEGSGSNLKTAEAILTGNSVVATDHSFRSYERFKSLSGLYFANTPQQFKKELVKALGAPRLKRTSSEDKLAQEVDWRYALQKLIDTVRNYEK